MLDTARACRITYNDVRLIRDRLVDDLEEWMGPAAIANSTRFPHGEEISSWIRKRWHAGLIAGVGEKRESVYRSVGAFL